MNTQKPHNTKMDLRSAGDAYQDANIMEKNRGNIEEVQYAVLELNGKV